MASEAKVKVEQGWLLGEKLQVVTEDGEYYSFKGVPFAQPPLGKLRFKEPQPPLPWEGVRKATVHGPECPHVDIFTQQYIPGDEDCLYLNVYTPELLPKKPFPVMVFIHGGGYKSGSGNTFYYGPDFLMKHGVILVTINYRLDALGFLCLDSEDAPGNAGLKDQVAAFKWVKNNINNFGGDPNNVTVFGESAGGASTGFHVLSPLSKGLFQRAVLMSGVPFCDWSLPFEPRRRAFNLGKEIGLDTNDDKKLFEYLQSVPVETLVNKSAFFLSSEPVICNPIKMYPFTPVVEKNFGQKHFLTESPEEILKKGRSNDVDVIIGYTSQESIFNVEDFMNLLVPSYNQYVDLFVPKHLLMKLPPIKALEIGDKIRKYYIGDKVVTDKESMNDMATYLSENSFVYDIYRFLRLIPTTNKNKYLYQFSCISERNVFSAAAAKYNAYGASHLEDLVYLFPWSAANLKVTKDSKSYKMIQQTCKLFTNFAKFGNPTPDNSLGVTWQKYNNDTKHYLDIDENLKPRQNPREKNFQFWDSIYNEASKYILEEQ